jgi:hypothetical protein
MKQSTAEELPCCPEDASCRHRMVIFRLRVRTFHQILIAPISVLALDVKRRDLTFNFVDTTRRECDEYEHIY